MSKKLSNISLNTVERVVSYLSFLKSVDEPMISSTAIAAALSLNRVQVRKDLAAVATGGKPKVGYSRAALIGEIEAFLGYDTPLTAILVGTGNLGKALLSYAGFENYGLSITAAFDVCDSVTGKNLYGKPVYDISQLAGIISQSGAKIALLCVPAAAAQQTADILVNAGIQAIWNFTPKNLKVRRGITVKNENMPAGFAILSKMMQA